MGDFLPLPASATRPRVLLLEDDDGVRRSLHLLLHGRGYEVRSFASAAPLLADPSLAEADVLISDYRLPDSDGLGVRRALERQGWTGRSVLITGFADAGLCDQAQQAGYDSVLAKPLRQHELACALAA